MEEQSTQQEVLLLTGTSFSARQRIENEGIKTNLDENSQLEEACWNGLSAELLAGIIEKTF